MFIEPQSLKHIVFDGEYVGSNLKKCFMFYSRNSYEIRIQL